MADFFAALRRLRAQAGEPSLRDIARASGQLSHDTVSRTLTGPALPRWANVEAVVRALGGDPEAIKTIWLAARVAHEGRPVRDATDEYLVETYKSTSWVPMADGDLPDPSSVRVVLVDDHPLFRFGLKVVLEEAGFPVVGEAANGVEALAVVGEHRPDVVVMDLFMPEMSGVEATARLVQQALPVRILVLTMFDDTDSILNAIRAGAEGYLLKGAGSAEIVRAIRQVAAGVPFFTAAAASSMLTHFREVSGESTDASAVLSPREREVLELFAAGRTNAQIARTMNVSHSTVDTYMARIRSKLGVRNRAGLVRYALERDVTE